jgi:hypothetical protein
MYEALLRDGEQLLGPLHPDTLIFRSDYGFWTGRAGDPDEACRLLAEMIDAAAPLLGAQHPDVLTARVRLARFTGEAGNPATARDMVAALLPVIDATLGSDNPLAIAP